MPSKPITLYPPFIADSVLLTNAYEFCARAHAGMVRKSGGDPYLNHPVRVASALWYANCDDAVVAAGFLHDVVEDTSYTLTDIVERFDEEVMELVDALTEDKTIADYEHRKSEHLQKVLRADPRAGLIKTADILMNLQDTLVAYEVEDERLSERFNGTLDQKEEHISVCLAGLRALPDVATFPVYQQLERTFAEFLAVRRDPNRRPLSE